MDQAFHAASPTSSYSDDAACIDPQLLRLDRDHNAATLLSAMKMISTVGSSHDTKDGYSDEAGAGGG
jgi:hypothetical protein